MLIRSRVVALGLAAIASAPLPALPGLAKHVRERGTRPPGLQKREGQKQSLALRLAAR